MEQKKRRFRHLPSTVYLIKSLEAAGRSHTDRLVRDSPVTTMQYVALGVLQQAADGMSAAALARRSFVTPQSIQDVIRALAAKGLIDKARSEVNRREVLIRISVEGRRTLDGLEPEMAELNDALLEGFSDDEVEMFRSLLQRARKNLEGFSVDS